MKDALSKLKPLRTVVERTKPKAGLPKLALYTEWLSGQFKRRLVDVDGASHDIDDLTIQSHFKVVSGSKSKVLIDKHWADHKVKSQTVRNSD